MRVYPYLSSVALVSVLLAGSAYATPALAQKGALLAPVTGWAITKVDEDAGNAYCALARRFRQNTILTVAKNLSGEASLALDFQAPKLDPAQNMTIVLDPGAGQERSYHVAPVSAKAFVVRLGRDRKFFEALNKTGYLRIEAGGGTYSFNLSDMDAGQESLGSCLAALTDPAAGDDDGGRLEALQQDIEGLRSENKRLSGLASRSGAGDDVIIRDISRDAGALETANRNLRSQAMSGMSAGEAMGETERAANVREQNGQLRAAVIEASAAQRDLENMQYKLVSLQQENERLSSDLNNSRSRGELQSTRSELYVLKEENGRLQKLLEQKAGSPVVVEALQNRVVSLEEENLRLASNLKQSNAEQLLNTVQPSAGDDLQQKVDDLSAQVRDKDQKLVQVSNLSLEIENLKTRNQDLERQLLEHAHDKDTIAGLNEKVRSLQEENNRLIVQLQDGAPGKSAALAQENAELKKQLETLRQGSADASALRVELDKVRAENEKLKAGMAAAKPGATDNQEIATLRRENEELKQKIAALTDENKSLTAENGGLKERLAKFMESAKETLGLKKKPAPAAAPSEPVDLTAKEIDMPPPIVASEDMNAAPVPDASAQGMTEAQRQEAMLRETMNAPPPANTPAEPPADIAWKAPDAAPPESLPEKGFYQPSLSVQDVVVGAQIAEAGDVRLVEKVSGSKKLAYQWQSGSVYGSAEQRPLADSAAFRTEVQGYLDKTHKRCDGDFAAVADSLQTVSGGQAQGYEIACVGKSINTTASLLFVDKNGTFTVLASETTADKMDEAMDMRDRLLKNIQ